MVSHRDDTSKGKGSIEKGGHLLITIQTVLDSKKFLPERIRQRIAGKVFDLMIADKSSRSEAALGEIIDQEVRKMDQA